MDQEENNSQENKKDQPITENTDQPNMVKEPEAPVNEVDNKKSKKKFSKPGIIVITILILVFLIVGTIPIVSNIQQHKAPAPTSYYKPEESLTNNHEQTTKNGSKPATTSEGLPDCSQIQDQAEIDVCETIAGVAEYLADRYYPTDSQIVLDYNYKENEGPIYKPEHLIMATASIPGHRAYELKSKYTSANEYLLDNGFTEVSRTISGGLWDIPTYINYENGVICEGGMSFSCGNIKWYPAEGSENANLLNDLARVGIRDEGWDAERNAITASTDRIQNSEFTPYQTINISGFNAGISFYRINPTAEWQFGYAMQDAMLCNSFDSTDKQKAYVSMLCQIEDSNDLTTVKEYYNL